MSISWTPRSITTPMSRTRPGNELTRRAVAVIRDVETVRCGAARLHVRVRDSDQVRDLGVNAGVVLAHRADPDDPDAHRRRHSPAKEASGYKRVAGAPPMSKPSYPFASSVECPVLRWRSIRCAGSPSTRTTRTG